MELLVNLNNTIIDKSSKKVARSFRSFIAELSDFDVHKVAEENRGAVYSAAAL